MLLPTILESHKLRQSCFNNLFGKGLLVWDAFKLLLLNNFYQENFVFMKKLTITGINYLDLGRVQEPTPQWP